jgi:hypothetical protein
MKSSRTSTIGKLIAYSEAHRLLLLCLDEDTSTSLEESRQGANRFSLTVRHDVLSHMRAPCLCLLYLTKGNHRSAHLGITKSKRAVTTLDSAVQIVSVEGVKPSKPADIVNLLPKQPFRARLEQDLLGQVSVLSEGVSREVVTQIAAIDDNRHHLERLAYHLLRSDALPIHTQMQMDAIALALAAFGLDKDAKAASISFDGKADGSLQFYEIDHILEDNLIAHDARAIPGYNLVKSDATGHAVFVSGQERLDVYTANRTPLEKAFGVDLVYVNVSKGNVVMVQYKMLEREGPSGENGPPTWVFRPDKQFAAEKSRMAAFRKLTSQGDYRLNAEPFYFKFAKRFQGPAQGGILLPREHLDLFLTSGKAVGPQGSPRVCYDALEGRYLRETEFLGLIRSGYIGTHAVDTNFLVPLIEAIIKGKQALIYAVQSTMSRDADCEGGE